MIFIINQHRGDLGELENHLQNYVEKWKDIHFYMIMLVDQSPTTRSLEIVSKFNQKYGDRLMIYHGQQNIGLTPARQFCLDKVKEYKVNKSQVILGCTNSLWRVPLDYYLYNKLKDYKGVTLIPCDYVNGDPYPRDLDNLVKVSDLNYVSFSNWFNNNLRPDSTLMFSDPMGIELLPREEIYQSKYVPEEVSIYKYMKDNRLNLFRQELQTAWYNKEGLSLGFNRKFMIDNSNGFKYRAEFFLDKYLDNEIILTSDKLKHLCYDYVTLGGLSDKKYMDTMLEPILDWALKRWLKNSNYNHQLYFKEEVKSESNNP